MSALSNFLGQVFSAPYRVKGPGHAERLYVDDYYRLTPKIGFMYYVVFNINRNSNPLIQNFVAANGREVGMLVKTVELPKFKMQTETLNQYNRKTIVQSKIDYQPVNFTFHDDHNNTTVSLWEAYYRYYFADSKEDTRPDENKPTKYANNKYKETKNITESFNYGMNNGQKDSFFDSIVLYQLARQQFTAFRLVNPMITDWSHDQLDQSTSKLLENKMTVAYESVQYATGQIKKDNPAGFASIHYDQRPSPLSVNGNNTIFGQGGIFDSAAGILGGIGDTSPLGLFGTIQKGVSLGKNLKNVSGASLKAEGYSILTGALGKIGKSENSRVAYQLGVSSNNASTPAGIGSLGLNTFKGLGDEIGRVTNGVLSNLVGKNSSVAQIGASAAALLGGGLALPSILPKTTSGLTSLKASQEAEIAKQESKLATSRSMKANYDAQIAAAKASGDEFALANIYDTMSAEDYTDPAEIEAYIASLESNVSKLNSSIDSASNLLELEIQSSDLEESEYDGLNNSSMNSFDFPGYEEEITEDVDAEYLFEENQDIETAEWAEYNPEGDD